MTLIGALLGVGAHGGYYAPMTCLPTFLKSERHPSVSSTGGYRLRRNLITAALTRSGASCCSQ